MMWRHVQRLLGVLVLTALVVGTASTLCADVTITMENEVKTSDGTQTTTVTQYYTPTKLRSEYGEQSVSIINLDEGRIITLMPATKNYMERTLDEVKKQGAKVEPPEPKLTVEETDETEEINGYECQKIIVRVETTLGDRTVEQVTEHWMTADAEGVEAVHEFQKKMTEAFKDLPQSAAALEARKRFAERGLFPIKTVNRTQLPNGEMVVTMTVTKIEEGDLDDELFEVPEDYTELQTNVSPQRGSDSEE